LRKSKTNTMRLYALIGYPLTHSFSKKYFTEKFLRENIEDIVFENFSFEHIEHVQTIIEEQPLLKGFAITIPHKKSIVPYLHSQTKAVQQIGACNCVAIHQNKLNGYNTDVVGFQQSFQQLLQPWHTSALVLGTGGASAAVEYVLQQLQIPYTLVSRLPKQHAITYQQINQQTLQQHSIVINCTPVGTFPNVEEAPLLPYHLLTPQHYLYDLVYNPAETLFLQYGKQQGCTIKNGYDMLAIQAEENWKIWNENE
jgi:shikimate dehydrogenase